MERRVIRILGRATVALALTAVLAFAAVAIALETLVDADELASRLDGAWRELAEDGASYPI